MSSMHSSPERTLVADALLTGPAEHTELFMMIFTLVFLIFFVLCEIAQLKCIELLCDLLRPAAVDELSELQGGSAMRALGSLFCQPTPNAAEAAQLGAVRAQPRIAQFLHANKTSEHFSNALHALLVHGRGSPGGSGLPPAPSVAHKSGQR